MNGKFLKTKERSGFYLCVVEPLYCSRVENSKLILPIKDGFLFNPEYQHSRVLSIKKLCMINDFHKIKKTIEEIFSNENLSYDYHLYRINKRQCI